VGLSASLSGRPGATVPGMVNLGTVLGDPDEITVSTTDPDKVTVWLGAAGETDLTRRKAEEFAALLLRAVREIDALSPARPGSLGVAPAPSRHEHRCKQSTVQEATHGGRGTVLRSRGQPDPTAGRDDRAEPRPDHRPLPRPRRAGQRPPGRPPDLGGVPRRRRGGRPRPARPRHRAGRPGRHLVAQQRRVGHPAVRHRQGRRHPGQRQPGLPHQRARLRARPVGRLHPGAGARLPAGRLRRHGRVGRRRDPGARPPHRARRRPAGRRDGLGRPARGGGSRAGRPAARPRGAAAVRRPDQHPVHLGHHRLPQGRHPQPPQHPQQRLLHRRGLRLQRGRPGLHPGAAVPLLRHGARQPGVHDARGGDGLPGRGLRPGGDPGRGGGRALYQPVRGAYV
jgi:hypothetical protein